LQALRAQKREYLIAFNMIRGVGPRRMAALVEAFGSLDRAWRAGLAQLTATPGIGAGIAGAIVEQRGRIDPLREEQWARQRGGRIVTIADGEYPSELHALADPPPALYIVGELPPGPRVAVVGTRRASPTGIRQARAFASELSRRGIPVVSGLARGIDEAAHTAAVECAGSTVAVLGSNIGRIYPSEHRGLAERIAASGALVSEFASPQATHPGNFPRRNRIIAALSERILVVQAGIRSGAMNTADWAAELGKDVWAVPGEISDPLRGGCHRLIRDGAGLAAAPGDVVEGLPQAKRSRGERRDAVAELYRRGASPDQISTLLNMPITAVLAKITELELAGGAGS